MNTDERRLKTEDFLLGKSALIRVYQRLLVFFQVSSAL